MAMYTKIRPVILLSFFFVCFISNGQKLKFAKVNKDMLTESFYPSDSAAIAAVLARKVTIGYLFSEVKGFQVETTVRERIKIYASEGFKYATIAESLYKNGKKAEKLTVVKAESYTLDNDKVVHSKLRTSDTFTKGLNEYFDEVVFTVPNVKEGSVLEYEYKITSPFPSNIDEIILQFDIPIKEQEITVSIPQFFVFTSILKGYLGVEPTFSKKQQRMTYVKNTKGGYAQASSSQRIGLEYYDMITHYHLKDIPALKEEPYVNNLENYRGSIHYELKYFDFPDLPRKDFTTSWEQVVRTVFENEDFGRQLKLKGYFKSVLKELYQDQDSERDKAMAIFNYVKEQMTWNGYNGYNTDKGVKQAYKERSGNAAEINLMLIAMLRDAGLKANPVLISTRDHGTPVFPTTEGFNYVLASVQINEEEIFLDATNKYSEPNILPLRTLNGDGRVINEDGSFATVSVMPKTSSKQANYLNITVEENGDIHGKMRKVYSGHDAYLFRNRYGDLAQETYLENLESRNLGMLISDHEIKNKKTPGKSISENFSYSLENQTSIIGDKLYFSPLFGFAMDENPFKSEERSYPVEFSIPWEIKYFLNIAIPDDYEVLSIPEPVNMVLGQNIGSYKFNISLSGNMITVLTDFKINEVVIPAENYTELKEFFKVIVEKEAEKVVLSKSKSK